VGQLLAVADASDVVDAAVVVTAVVHNAAIATSDAKDLARLAAAVGARIPLIEV